MLDFEIQILPLHDQELEHIPKELRTWCIQTSQLCQLFKICRLTYLNELLFSTYSSAEECNVQIKKAKSIQA